MLLLGYLFIYLVVGEGVKQCDWTVPTIEYVGGYIGCEVRPNYDNQVRFAYSVQENT